MWTTPLTDKMDAVGRPRTVVRQGSQDVVSSVNVPAGTQDFIPIATEESDEHAPGFTSAAT